MTERKGWANPEQRLEPHNGGAPMAHSYAEQGILLHLNLQGTPLPVYGCVGADGTLWRTTPDMGFEDRLANLMKWESEFGQLTPRMTQAEAVDTIGPNANYVYNPWVNGRANMGIDTPDGWQRLFPERKDYTQTKLVEPKPIVQPQMSAPAQEKTTLRLDPPADPTYPAGETFYDLGKPVRGGVSEPFAFATRPSFLDKVKTFFGKLFGR